MADGAQASLWGMPGVADCSQALRRIEEGAPDFSTAEHPHGLLRVPSPPAPADRRAWEPLLRRAKNELAADAEYVEGPPRTTAKGVLTGAPGTRLTIYNGFVRCARRTRRTQHARRTQHTRRTQRTRRTRRTRRAPPP